MVVQVSKQTDVCFYFMIKAIDFAGSLNITDGWCNIEYPSKTYLKLKYREIFFAHSSLYHCRAVQILFIVFNIWPLNLMLWTNESLRFFTLTYLPAYMRQWIGSALIKIMAPSHYLNQCWDIVNWTLRNKVQWNFNQNTNIFVSRKCIWKYRVWNGSHFVRQPFCVCFVWK